MNRASDTRTRLDALTGVRFFAAMHVVVYHYAGALLAGAPSWMRHIADTGYIGVSLFYVLSGFVLAYNYVDKKGGLRGTPDQFYIARFARIYPAYALALLLAAPFFFNELAQRGSLNLAGLGRAATVPLLVQSWSPSTWSLWNYPAWSLSDEAFFYLVFPFVLPLVARLGNRGLLACAAGAWAVSMSFTALIASARLPIEFDTATVVLYVLPFSRFPEFLIGVVIGLHFLRAAPEAKPRWLRSLPGLLSISAAAAILVILGSGKVPRLWLNNALLAPLFALLTYALASKGGLLRKLLSIRWIVVLGDASYSIYILQEPLHRWAILASKRLAFMPEFRSAEFFILYAAVLIAFSVAALYWVEAPSRVLLKRVLTRRPSTIAAAR